MSTCTVCRVGFHDCHAISLRRNGREVPAVSASQATRLSVRSRSRLRPASQQISVRQRVSRFVVLAKPLHGEGTESKTPEHEVAADHTNAKAAINQVWEASVPEPDAKEDAVDKELVKAKRAPVKVLSDWVVEETKTELHKGWGTLSGESQAGHLLRAIAVTVAGALLLLGASIYGAGRMRGKRYHLDFRPLPSVSVVGKSTEVPPQEIANRVQISEEKAASSIPTVVDQHLPVDQKRADEPFLPHGNSHTVAELDHSTSQNLATANPSATLLQFVPDGTLPAPAAAASVPVTSDSVASAPVTSDEKKFLEPSKPVITKEQFTPAEGQVKANHNLVNQLGLEKLGDSLAFGQLVHQEPTILAHLPKLETKDNSDISSVEVEPSSTRTVQLLLAPKEIKDFLKEQEKHADPVTVHLLPIQDAQELESGIPDLEADKPKQHEHTKGIRGLEKGAKRGVRVGRISDGRVRVHAGSEAAWSNLSDKAANVPSSHVIQASADKSQTLALEALQKLKIVEENVNPQSLCTKREGARWLISASDVLSRGQTSRKVLPAVPVGHYTSTDLAFDDVLPSDPDFGAIQGLAEAGLVPSKFTDQMLALEEDYHHASHRHFNADRPLTRQELVSWRMALEKRQLPRGEELREEIMETYGYVDVALVTEEALPAVAADLAEGEDSIIARSFGYTLRLQPNKPVTHGQVASALASGSASPVVQEAIEALEAERVADEVFQETARAEQEIVDLVTARGEEIVQKIEAGQAALSDAQKDLDDKVQSLGDLKQACEKEREEIALARSNAEAGKAKLLELSQQAQDKLSEVQEVLRQVESEREQLETTKMEALVEMRRTRAAVKALERARIGEVTVVESVEVEEGDQWLRESDHGVSTTARVLEDRPTTLRGRADQLLGSFRAALSGAVVRAVEALGRLRDWVEHWWKEITHFVQHQVGDVGNGTEKLRSRVSHTFKKVQAVTRQAVDGVGHNLQKVAVEARSASAKLVHRFRHS